ncbi:hypothetical protein IQ268_14635 [Oculatella sp. LEGE 06141]|uniref:hypothetical protein n=1 Tax=Oculatella sp. LEGE 06141 TaxID=1828648 RepID=UPI0018809789|nr:hypothetical protein [Oculatella sp. LEGE 06141]MBE9179804.1 hypothetical protein [Oculatella sp. LEGE 06141]
MLKSSWRSSLSRLNLAVWLPLPLVGLGFLLGTGWITERVMSHAYETTVQLQSDEQPQVNLSLTVRIVAIEAEIDRREDVTEVTVKTSDSILRELEMDFPVTEFAEVEDALVQELGLSRELVKRLTRYRID